VCALFAENKVRFARAEQLCTVLICILKLMTTCARNPFRPSLTTHYNSQQLQQLQGLRSQYQWLQAKFNRRNGEVQPWSYTRNTFKTFRIFFF